MTIKSIGISVNSVNLAKSAKLAKDIEEFKKNGGTITTLKMGESLSSDYSYNGSTRASYTPQNIETNPSPTKTEKIKTPNQKPATSTANKNSSKPKKAKEEQASNLAKIRSAMKEAIAQGKTTFLAPCKKHGNTEYEIFRENPRCNACRLENYNKHMEKLQKINKDINATSSLEEMLRREDVKKAKNEAIAAGKKYFYAKCLHHGNAMFRIYDNVGRCVECRKEINNKKIYEYKVEKGTAIAINDDRLNEGRRVAEITKKKNEAIALNLKEFQAECLYHKMTKYVIFRNVARCEKCLKISEAKARQKRNKTKHDNIAA